jgi:oligoendopeptidase F
MLVSSLEIPAKPKRKFLPQNIDFSSWENLKPYFEELTNRNITSVPELENWLQDRSELEAVLEEELGWRYIRMTIDTTNKDFQEAYNSFVENIEPNVAPYSDKFDKKLLSSPFLNRLENEKYRIFLRSVKKRTEIFREENIPLFTKIQTESQKYGTITGAMTVEVDGKEITMQKASNYLKSTDRKVREEVFRKMQERRLKDTESLELFKLRNKAGLNAGFSNYRDFMFAALGRFDYTKEDCFNFHESIRKHITPINASFLQERKERLNLDPLKPWDLEVDISGKPQLVPYKGGKELVSKTIECFTKIRPYYGECIQIMEQMGHLDLESKQGKAPGGYNYPLYEIGVPFIFMNSVDSVRDIVTMVHEGGHAIHSFLSRNLELTDFKSVPSEVAELASMSMELISMEHWDVFFDNEEDLKRAKKEELEKVLSVLPWVAMVDQFQHWIYENQNHTKEERKKAWLSILDKYNTNMVDWSGFEESRAYSWHKQLHIFEVPFYYIEYGMAQLGAIAVWRNYKLNPEKTLDQYDEALKLGYTKSISEIYNAAGISFDFSEKNVKELADFVKKELIQL